ncbi:MAG TPA: hypothetical protein ENI05_03150 [Porticoccus sp.]|nr:hypothetical protein [Porticoccus sp.]
MKSLQNALSKLHLPSLLKSKRFWSSIFGVVTVVVAYYEPGLEPYMPQIIEAVSIGVVALVAGYSLQDAVNAGVNAYLEYKGKGKDDA